MIAADRDRHGWKIDATISWEGATVRSPKEFRESLLRGHDFVRTVTEKMLTYALGLGVEHYDAPIVQQLVRGLERDEYRWSELVLGIVLSRPFQMRRALGEGPTVKRAAAAERR